MTPETIGTEQNTLFPSSLEFNIKRIQANYIADSKQFYFVESFLLNNGCELVSPYLSKELQFKDFQTDLAQTNVFPVSFEYLDLSAKLVLRVLYFDDQLGPRPISELKFCLFNSKKIFRHGAYILTFDSDSDTNGKFHKDSSIHLISKRRKQLSYNKSAKIFDCKELDDQMESKLNKKLKKYIQKAGQGFIEIEFPRYFNSDSNQSFLLVFDSYLKTHEILYTNFENRLDSSQTLLGGQIFDPEISGTTLATASSLKVSRSIINEFHEPLPEEHLALKSISTKSDLNIALTESDLDLIWKYRHFLMKKPKFYKLFLQSICTSDIAQSTKVNKFYHEWKNMTDITDIIFVLIYYAHIGPVKLKCIESLQHLSLESINFWMPQLLLCLTQDSIEIFINNFVNNADGSNSKTINSIPEDYNDLIDHNPEVLLSFIIQKSRESLKIASKVFWFFIYSMTIQTTPRNYKQFKFLINVLLMSQKLGAPSEQQIFQDLERQNEFFRNLCLIYDYAESLNIPRTKKIEKMKVVLKDSLSNSENSIEKIKLTNIVHKHFFDTEFKVEIIDPTSFYMFNSKLVPVLLSLVSETGENRKIIFKGNDDIKVDALILQIINVIDKVLLEMGFDLRFTNYKVIPLEKKRGIIEFVESLPLSNVKEKYGSISKYFKHVSEKKGLPIKSLLDNYIRSVGKDIFLCYII
ncbi:MAG: Phosphatidylinositol 3-kinase catalytic subunit type 3 [Paramarteilia canceri]